MRVALRWVGSASARSPSCDRRLKEKKQISPAGEIFLLLRFDTLTSQRAGQPRRAV
jgi:hypothetical protein